MNKNLKKIGILLLVVLLAVAAVFGLEKISEKIHLKNIKDYDWLLKNVTLLNSSMGKNIYTVSKSEDIDIYNENAIESMRAYEELNQFFSIDTSEINYDKVIEEFMAGKIIFSTKQFYNAKGHTIRSKEIRS